MSSIILRRGMNSVYYRFMRIISEANGTTLIIDRRKHERRRDASSCGDDRRVTDRRSEPPATWHTEGFIAADESDGASSVERRSRFATIPDAEIERAPSRPS